MKPIKIDAPIKPVPFPRPRFDSKRGIVFDSKTYHDFKDTLGLLALQAMRGRAPFSGEVTLHADFYRPMPKLRKGSKPQVSFIGDIDNYLKAILDALNGICYLDDRQVTRISAAKLFGQHHITIVLEEL